jgi:hypothetical protein
MEDAALQERLRAYSRQTLRTFLTCGALAAMLVLAVTAGVAVLAATYPGGSPGGRGFTEGWAVVLSGLALDPPTALAGMALVAGVLVMTALIPPGQAPTGAPQTALDAWRAGVVSSTLTCASVAAWYISFAAALSVVEPTRPAALGPSTGAAVAVGMAGPLLSLLASARASGPYEELLQARRLLAGSSGAHERLTAEWKERRVRVRAPRASSTIWLLGIAALPGLPIIVSHLSEPRYWAAGAAAAAGVAIPAVASTAAARRATSQVGVPKTLVGLTAAVLAVATATNMLTMVLLLGGVAGLMFGVLAALTLGVVSFGVLARQRVRGPGIKHVQAVYWDVERRLHVGRLRQLREHRTRLMGEAARLRAELGV